MRRNGTGGGLKMLIPLSGEVQSGDIVQAYMKTEVTIVTCPRGLVKFVA